MTDIVQNENIEYTKVNANKEFKERNYPLAKTIFELLWNNSNKDDVNLLYDYGKTLRKTNESFIFIEICRELSDDKKIMSNKWIVSNLCWCFYDCYIKSYSVEEINGFSDFIKRAQYIIDNCEQMKAGEHFRSPYYFTVRKVVKIYTERASKNYKAIVKWLSYLDPDKLSEEVFKFQDETGKDRELASPKEFYYQNMAKALEKIEKYEDCIANCEAAFQQIDKFHYRNHIWLKARMYYCKCMLQGDDENAIAEYKALAYKENYWFMYHKLAQICWRYNKVPEALLYSSKAFTCRFENEKMVNLMLDTALLWQALGNNSNAKWFFQASAYYRKRHRWSFPEEVEYAVKTLAIDVEAKPNIREMQRISNEYIENIEGNSEIFKGKINNILPHRGSGFIKPDVGDSNVYFNMNDVAGKIELKKGDAVDYELSKNKNGKVRAIQIRLRS